MDDGLTQEEQCWVDAKLAYLNIMGPVFLEDLAFLYAVECKDVEAIRAIRRGDPIVLQSEGESK